MTMTRTTKFTMAFATVAALAATVPAAAMQFGPETMVYDPTPNADRARELRTRAEELFSQPKHWKKAARLLEQSAALREANDPEAYTCLMYAGRLRAAVKDLPAARANLEKAAAQALARGSVIEAAHAYIDAAHVASSEKQIEAARELVRRATLLSESPLLSAEQRQILESRLKAA
jgi:tetratricopeptide (TPR) repeat protein